MSHFGSASPPNLVLRRLLGLGVTISMAPLPEPSPPLLPGSVAEYLVTNVPMCAPDATTSPG